MNRITVYFKNGHDITINLNSHENIITAVNTIIEAMESKRPLRHTNENEETGYVLNFSDISFFVWEQNTNKCAENDG